MIKWIEVFPQNLQIDPAIHSPFLTPTPLQLGAEE